MKKDFLVKFCLNLIICLNIVNLIPLTFASQEYSGEIYHLCINGILSYPSILKNDNDTAYELDSQNITPTEFRKILNTLKNNNYILVRLSDCYEISNNTIYKKKLVLPSGKIPVILSINNTNYGKQGFVDKLIIENDSLASYTSKRSINERIHTDKEFVTILDNFIKKNPKFSHNNAKGLIMISGNEGIFGYKTQKTQASSRYQIKKCSEIINYLSKTGWEFCAKSYNDTNLNSSNLDFASAVNKWNNEVKSIIGNTRTYYLNENINNSIDVDYKCELLLHSNFKLILNDSFEDEFDYSPYFNNQAMIMNVKKISGDTLRNHREDLLPFFDSEIIYDRLNRQVAY